MLKLMRDLYSDISRKALQEEIDDIILNFYLLNRAVIGTIKK